MSSFEKGRRSGVLPLPMVDLHHQHGLAAGDRVKAC